MPTVPVLAVSQTPWPRTLRFSYVRNVKMLTFDWSTGTVPWSATAKRKVVDQHRMLNSRRFMFSGNRPFSDYNFFLESIRFVGQRFKIRETYRPCASDKRIPMSYGELIPLRRKTIMSNMSDFNEIGRNRTMSS